MRIGIQATGLLAVTALSALILGCSPTPATSDPSAEQGATNTTAKPDPKPAGHAGEMTSPGKTSAPVKTTLTSSASSGTVVLTLTMEALADIPRGVGRIVIPDQGRVANGDIKVVKGDLEVDFGAVPHGEKRELQVTLEVRPSGKLKIFAGVDCHMTAGILMHKTAQPVVVGE